MERADQEAIDMFISITGASATVAIQKLEAHAGNLNEAVNAHFSEGDRNTTLEAPVVVPEDDLMEIDDPIQVESSRSSFPALPSSRNVNPFTLLDPGVTRSIFDTGTGLSGALPFLSHPREARQIPIVVKDGNEQSSHSGFAPIIQDVTGISREHGPEIRETVVIDEEDAGFQTAPTRQISSLTGGNNNVLGGYSRITHSRPTARGVDDTRDYGNDIEEQMIRAAIEASKRDAEIGYPDRSAPIPPPRQSHFEDPELAHAVSLSLKAAEQEKVGSSEVETFKSVEMEDLSKLAAANGRLEVGGSSAHDKAEDIEKQPLVRHRSRPLSSGYVDVDTPPSRLPTSTSIAINSSSLSSAWGGISSLEHDEAVMLEAALFGGIHEGSGYQVPYEPHQFIQNGLGGTVDPYAQWMPRPPSPSLTAQRLIREQQDDEYLASLQADREKEMKAREEDEIHRKEEQAAREAALEEERLKEEELRRKLEEEQEMERQLAAKEASLPHEPASNDENAVTLFVRMPDGSRRGRRFLNSHKLQYLFDFIDVGRAVKPGTYRLVRPYPRRAFSDGECATTFNELGLTSRQEALFLELI